MDPILTVKSLTATLYSGGCEDPREHVYELMRARWTGQTPWTMCGFRRETLEKSDHARKWPRKRGMSAREKREATLASTNLADIW